MDFGSQIGQDKVKGILNTLYKEDRFPHAMLLTGPSGNGKLATALSIAAGLQCSETEDLTICGSCIDCLKAKQFIHPDIHFAFPVIKKGDKKREDTTSTDFLAEFREFVKNKIYEGYPSWLKSIGAENKLANINKTECFQIIKTLSLKKYEGQYKVQIIWMAEMLGKEGNRLLKLIEEPTPDTIILLIAEKPKHILNTILSRCQILNIPPFKDDEIGKILDLEPTDKRLIELTRLANGNASKAIELSYAEENAWDELLLDIFRVAYTMNGEKLASKINTLVDLGKNGMIAFCEYTLSFFREYIKAKNLNSVEHSRLTQGEKNTVLKMMKVIDNQMAEKIIYLFEENINLLNRNANAKILWMDQLLSIGIIMKKKSA